MAILLRGHLQTSPFTSTKMSSLVHISFCTCAIMSVENFSEMELLGHRINVFLILMIIAKLHSIAGVSFYIPTSIV